MANHKPLSNVEATCPKCGQEMEVELPEGTYYTTKLEIKLAEVSRIREKSRKILMGFTDARNLAVKYSVGINFFNALSRFKKMQKDMRKLLTFLEDDFKKKQDDFIQVYGQVVPSIGENSDSK